LNLKNRINELNRIDKANEKIKDKLVSQTTHYPKENFERAATDIEKIRQNLLYNSSTYNTNKVNFIDRYERNNFFVGVDPAVLEPTQQRVYFVETPYTNAVFGMNKGSSIILGGARKRPKTASSNRSSMKANRSGNNTIDASPGYYNPGTDGRIVNTINPNMFVNSSNQKMFSPP